MDINEAIELYKHHNSKRLEMNNLIEAHFYPKIMEYCKSGDLKSLDELIDKLPDTPFTLRALRIKGMYFG